MVVEQACASEVDHQRKENTVILYRLGRAICMIKIKSAQGAGIDAMPSKFGFLQQIDLRINFSFERCMIMSYHKVSSQVTR